LLPNSRISAQATSFLVYKVNFLWITVTVYPTYLLAGSHTKAKGYLNLKLKNFGASQLVFYLR
jgi:hypothetical protein